jgi:hypothetical protein
LAVVPYVSLFKSSIFPDFRTLGTVPLLSSLMPLQVCYLGYVLKRQLSLSSEVSYYLYFSIPDLFFFTQRIFSFFLFCSFSLLYLTFKIKTGFHGPPVSRADWDWSWEWALPLDKRSSTPKP